MEINVSNNGNAPVELSNLSTNDDVFSSNLSNLRSVQIPRGLST